MHLRLARLTVSPLLLLGSLAAYSQRPLQRRTAIAPCYVESANQQCPSGVPVIPYSSQPQSMEREGALAQSRAATSRRRTLLAEAASQNQQPAHANPDAPDQSELLKNAKDPDFIRRNFKTMYVVTKGIEFFDAQQMKAALRKNPDFHKLNIEIVDDRHVADTVLIVSYTFAWDYPFELQHQNTTTVLFAGKGEGPFSGPLGAADVAREFVKAVKPWRVTTAPEK